ncbi:MAG: hypothetical protein FD181_269 [Prolixibacteraceae bacterium]|nr:MAG: hypothetical protein FD181_269 [Prolixibacteraceae bacterium]
MEHTHDYAKAGCCYTGSAPQLFNCRRYKNGYSIGFAQYTWRIIGDK